MSVTKADILAARFPEDIFGEDPTQVDAIRKRLYQRYHPDHGGDPDLFVALKNLDERAQKALRTGVYGKRETIAETVTITTVAHAYQVTRVAHTGSVSVTYQATYDDDDGAQQALLKVARKESDGKPIAREPKTLQSLIKANDLLTPYLPELIETCRYRHGKTVRPTSVFKLDDELYTLHEVYAAYPNGIHPRDAAWMIRRVLMALGLVHNAGWCHNQLSWRHILIHPEMHGLVLLDWTQATKYKEADGQTDIAQAVECFEILTNSSLTPRRFRWWLEGCQLAKHRLPDALTLLDEFDLVIEAIWGPKTFHHFSMPERK